MAKVRVMPFKEATPEELREGWTVSTVGSGAGLRKRSPEPETQPELSPGELEERMVSALRLLLGEEPTSSEEP